MSEKLKKPTGDTNKTPVDTSIRPMEEKVVAPSVEQSVSPMVAPVEVPQSGETTNLGQLRGALAGVSRLDQLGIRSKVVLSGDNIAETINAPQAPVNDALGIFTSQEEEQGIPGLKEAYETAQANRMRGEQLAKQEQLTIEGRAKKLGVLRGEQSQAAQQANLDLQTLGQAEQLALSSLQSAQATADKKAGILYNEYQQKVDLQLKFPGIDIDPTKDSFTDVSQKLEKYQDEERDRIKKESYKDALRAIGKSTEGSTEELEERIKKVNKDAYEKAQRQTEIQLENMELGLKEVKRKLNEAKNPPQPPSISELYNPNSTSIGNSGGSGGVDDYARLYNN